MSEKRVKRRVEMIESYWTGGEYGSDYVWSDNHGELVRCRDCRFRKKSVTPFKEYWCVLHEMGIKSGDWYCADGERVEQELRR